MDLWESLSVWRALEESSSKLTGFVKRACEVLGLDPNVDVLVSLKYIYEDPEDGINICGYYDPIKKLTVVSLPCLMKKDRALGPLGFYQHVHLTITSIFLTRSLS
jgi:hypothetical protein